MVRFIFFVTVPAKQKKYGNKQEKALDRSWGVTYNCDYRRYRDYQT